MLDFLPGLHIGYLVGGKETVNKGVDESIREKFQELRESLLGLLTTHSVAADTEVNKQ
jgi:hypothetical protein